MIIIVFVLVLVSVVVVMMLVVSLLNICDLVVWQVAIVMMM